MNRENPSKSVFVQTFGCQMNDRDSENIVALLGRHGYAQTPEPEKADLILLNTCAIREHASHKAISQLGRYAKLKKSGDKNARGPFIGLTGCLAQQEGEGFLKRFPFLDLLIGPDGIAHLPKLLADLETTRQTQVELRHDLDAPVFLSEILDYPVAAPEMQGQRRKHSAFVTISKGCDFRCTFCVVPKTRGPERSAPPEVILGEVHELARRGVREITLLGQNVNSYGKNFPTPTSFAALLRRIENEVDAQALRRVRFTTSHPVDLSEDLMRCFAQLPRLCKFLHLPVQSGDDRVLRRMKRLYTIEDYRDRLRRLRSYVPDIALSTDIIVGFPGETDEQFARTLDLLQEVRYNSLYAFKYSSRPHTPAERLGDDVPESVKEARLQQVLTTQRAISLEQNQKAVGTDVEVLVDEVNDIAPWKGFTGRTEYNRLVHFEAPQTEDLIGQLVRVKIEASGPNSLMGRWTTKTNIQK